MAYRVTGGVTNAYFQQQNTTLVHFLEFEFSGGVTRVCTASEDIDWNGFTWQAIGGAIQFGSISESTEEFAHQLDVKLSGIDQSFVSLVLTQNWRGRQIQIYRGNVFAEENRLALTSTLHLWDANGAVVATGEQLGPHNIRNATSLTGGAAGDFIDETFTLINDDGLTISVWVLGDVASTHEVHLQNAGATRVVTLDIINNDSGGLSAGVGTVVVAEERPDRVSLTRNWKRYVINTTEFDLDTDIIEMRFIPGAHGNPMVVAEPTVVSKIASDVLYQPTDTVLGVAGLVVPDPLLIFDGFMNGGFEITEVSSDETVTVSGTMVDHMVRFDRLNGIAFNQESHERYFEPDQFMDQIGNLPGKKITWGASR